MENREFSSSFISMSMRQRLSFFRGRYFRFLRADISVSIPIFIIIRAFFCRCGPNCSERFQLLATIVRDDDVISTPIYVPILVSIPIFGVIGDFKNFDDVLATPSSPQPSQLLEICIFVIYILKFVSVPISSLIGKF